MSQYNKSILLRVTEKQHKEITDEAQATGRSVQNIARKRLWPNDPEAISSTPSNAYVESANVVKNSLDAFYAKVEAGLLTKQTPKDVLQDAIAEGRAKLEGKE